MRVLLAMVLVTAACTLSACGSSDSDQVHSTLNRFASAVAAKDSKTICEQVLAPELVARLEGVGLPCETAIGKFFFSCNVKSPTLQIGRVTFDRGGATALVYSGARGQSPGIFELGLVKTSGGWRVASESAEKAGRGSCSSG